MTTVETPTKPRVYPARSTLNRPPSKPTIGVDPGYSTAVLLRVGNDAVNYGTIRPHKDGRTKYWLHEAGAKRDGAPYIYWEDLLRVHVERVADRVEWLTNTYAYLTDDGTFVVAVEQYVGPDRFRSIVTQSQARRLTVELALLPGVTVVPVAPRLAGALYRKRGGTGKWLDYYPPEIVGRQREFGWPANDGRPVELVGNEHGGNINVHVQAAFDIASYAWHNPSGRKAAA